MIDFSFTEEQHAIREAARRFAEERLAPDYLKREAEGHIHRDLVREMGRLGFLGVDLESEFGGLGQDSVTSGIVMEEIARGDFNVSYLQLLASLIGSIIIRHGKPERAQNIVPKICSGEQVVALGLTEPSGGSDAANLRLRARRTNAGYLLSGEKTSISMADQADQIVVFARTGEADSRARGISAFLVPLNRPGISCSRSDDVGTTAVGRGSVFFDDVEVEEEARLGEENQGFKQVMQGFDYSRALIGLQCLAPARASLDETWDYASEREAFGKPIISNQGVSEPLAAAETQYLAARLLCYHTLWLRDQGLPHTAEAAMCKWWAPKVAFDIIHECLLTHGHFGYSKSLPHQQRLRDVLGLHIGDGTRQIQKMIIAREKAGRMALRNGTTS